MSPHVAQRAVAVSAIQAGLLTTGFWCYVCDKTPIHSLREAVTGEEGWASVLRCPGRPEQLACSSREAGLDADT